MTRHAVIKRAARAAARRWSGAAKSTVAPAVAQHLLFAAGLTALLIGGLLGRDDWELGRLLRDTVEPFASFVLLATGFFGLICCGMFATAAAIGNTGE
jgi:hypothetical protein